MNEKLKITKVKLWIMKREKRGEDKRTQGKNGKRKEEIRSYMEEKK